LVIQNILDKKLPTVLVQLDRKLTRQERYAKETSERSTVENRRNIHSEDPNALEIRIGKKEKDYSINDREDMTKWIKLTYQYEDEPDDSLDDYVRFGIKDTDADTALSISQGEQEEEEDSEEGEEEEESEEEEDGLKPPGFNKGKIAPPPGIIVAKGRGWQKFKHKNKGKIGNHNRKDGAIKKRRGIGGLPG